MCKAETYDYPVCTIQANFERTSAIVCVITHKDIDNKKT